MSDPNLSLEESSINLITQSTPLQLSLPQNPPISVQLANQGPSGQVPTEIKALQGTIPWVISGTVNAQGITLSGAQLTVSSGTSWLNVANFPTIQTVQPKVSQDAQGNQNVNIVNTISGTVGGTVNVGNFPTLQQVSGNIIASQGTIPWTVSGITAPSNQSVTVTNWPNTQSVTGSVTTLQGTSPWSISGAITNLPGVTLPISGTISSIISASGLQNVHVDNWPTVQTTSINNFPSTQNITGTVMATQGTVPWTVSGVTAPTNQSVTITNWPQTSAVTQSTNPWTISGGITNLSGNTLAVSGTVTSVSGTQYVHVDNWPTVQTVAGNIGINNFPTSQQVTQGTSPWIVSGTVGGTLNVANLPYRKPAYTVLCSGLSLTANQIHTFIGVAPGINNPVILTELGIGCNSTSTGVLYAELVIGTNATNPPGTNSTSLTPTQIRGNNSIPSSSTAAFNWASEPTVLTTVKELGPLLLPSDPIIIQYPWTRELIGTQSINNLKFIGIRCYSSISTSIYGYMEWEEQY